MKFEVRGDRLYQDGAPVPFVPTPNVGGRMNPTMIIEHETAGRLTPGSSVSWLTQKKAKASAHLVIARDGSVTQLADFDRQTWHAGKSTWKGRSGCNRTAIGIELDGPGKLVRFGERCTAWFGETFDIAEYGLKEARTAAHGNGWWMPHSEAQIAVCEAVTAELAVHYGIDAEDCVGHYHVSPKRKVDPSPLFDFDHLRETVRATKERQPQPRNFVLAKGSRGKDVEAVQEQLAALGYDLGPAGADGFFGSRTRNAVLAWEAEQGRTLDGKVDVDDFDVLTSPIAKAMPETPVAAAAAETAKTAKRSVDATAVVSLGTLGMGALGSDELWGGLMSQLDRLTQGVAKLAGLGVKVPASYVIAVLIAVLIGVVWRWVNQISGAKS
jgi:N-acetyl-anhydromuramyl-L-alanine amidase AmpD